MGAVDRSALSGGDSAELNRKKLIEEFGSVLDESLIILIANERDLVSEFAEIRNILSQLAETARAEAATGFDPSGLGCRAEPEGLPLDGTTTSGNGVSGDSLGEYATTVSDFSDQSDNSRLTSQTDMSDAQKVQELKLIFQERFKDHTIRFILKRSDGNLERVFDELLNRQYLEDSGSLPKGIDGFLGEDEVGRAPRGKPGRARKAHAKHKKLAIDYKAVSPTISNGELEGADDPVQSPNARAACSASRLRLPLTPTMAATTSAATSSSPVSPDLSTAHMRAAAAALRRMGPLGRQGAAVYSERAREEVRAFTAQASVMADAHVAQQSTDDTIDLHGVFVLDGVRIARQRVWTWWNNLGEQRKAAAKRSGFTVVTGVGKHSAGGVSRLRQAVGAYLKNDGWKYETLTGSFYVTGRV
ncbi:Ubiquitin-binding protein CUE2 [Madurella mycetomatis]|uniref:Ubiquitin-binding protein CUE2 n=1 Tax=Madurella mycetomatis TaxID=100816 RepID=A0A175VSA6_9PEZI|nr:Ubiquitin-binding protein CUE2 [Madurella mycetomatis]